MTTDPQARKDIPVATGFVDYFPDAIAEVAHLSKVANEQHNPNSPLRWDRSKSGDESDALMRHFLERGTIDTDGMRHSAKVAWRALALLQKELEAEKARKCECNLIECDDCFPPILDAPATNTIEINNPDGTPATQEELEAIVFDEPFELRDCVFSECNNKCTRRHHASGRFICDECFERFDKSPRAGNWRPLD